MNINVRLNIKEIKEVKSRIREIRLQQGLMQKYVAEKTGIPQQLLSDYEHNKKLPRIDNAYKIARVLKCSVGDLYEE